MTTAPPALRFGLFLSQANKPLDQVYDEFQMAEDLGFDHAWLVDHLMDTDGPADHPCLEAWTLLAALATRTTRIRLGVLVSSNTFRHPALLLKEAVTVDHISAGRLTLGLGTGWHVDEHRRYGIDLPEAPERVDRFAEATELISLLMRQSRTTFSGKHYRLVDAPLEPKPVQQPRIPLLIAAHRPRMLRLAAQFADQWDTFAEMPGTATNGVSAGIEERIRALDRACRAIGRSGRDPPIDVDDLRGTRVRCRLRRIRGAPSASRVHGLLGRAAGQRRRGGPARRRGAGHP